METSLQGEESEERRGISIRSLHEVCYEMLIYSGETTHC